MRIRKFNTYYDDNPPSWVTNSREELEKEEALIKKWVGEASKPRKKKPAAGKKSIARHSGKKSRKAFYAVKNGRKKNVIVKTWKECSALVMGYPRAVYKGFSNEKEAIEYLK